VIGKQERWQEDLFVAGPLSSLIPDDHILKRVDAILDLSWLSELVKDTYCSDNGRRSIDPESALRLMLAVATVMVCAEVGKSPQIRLSDGSDSSRFYQSPPLTEQLWLAQVMQITDFGCLSLEGNYA
jgi:hypothetical protein